MGFVASIICMFVGALAGFGIPNPYGGGLELSLAGLLTLYSKSMFVMLMVFIASIIVYGFIEGSRAVSGFVDGAAFSLAVSSYLVIFLSGYRVDTLLPLFVALSRGGEGVALSLDWGQVAILTLILKNRSTILSRLLPRRGEPMDGEEPVEAEAQA